MLFKGSHSIKGSVIVLTAFSMFVFIMMMSYSIDISKILAARNQLQVAIDAAALAGASGLLISEGEASSRAISMAAKNNVLNEKITISMGNITYPSMAQPQTLSSGFSASSISSGSSYYPPVPPAFTTKTKIHINASKTVPLYFASLIGIKSLTINAQATAELAKVSQAKKLRPFAIPDYGYVLGDQVVIKDGSVGGKDEYAPNRTSSWHYPVDYPAMNRGDPEQGANEYRDNIKYGFDDWVFTKDILMTEPGNMQGPTSQGIEYIIDQDPGAYWNGNRIMNSRYLGYASPRIIIIPFFDHNITPKGGRANLTVTGFGSFFVVGMSGQDVIGIFLRVLGDGEFGEVTSSNTSVYIVHLIQ